MMRFRLRIFITDILHHLLMLVAIAILCWAILLSGIREVLPLLPKHRLYFEKQISDALHVPITFDEVNVSWYRLQPEISVTHLNVWNEKHQAVMKIPEVDLRLNLLSSLVSRKLEFSLIQVKSWQIHAYQAEDKSWKIAGTENVGDTSHASDISVEELFSGILAIHQLQLTHALVFLHPLHQKSLQIELNEMGWLVDGGTLKVYGLANLLQPTQNQLSFSMQMTSDWQSDFKKKMNGEFYVKFSPIDPSFWVDKSTLASYGWHGGWVNGKVWAHWQHDHWQDAQAKLQLQQLDLRHLANQKNLLEWKAPLTNLGLWWTQTNLGHQIQFDLQSVKGSFQLEHIFRTIMPYRLIDAKGQWTFQKDQHQVTIPQMHLTTADADIWAKLELNGSSTQSMEMKLQSTAHVNNLNHVSMYLPAEIMPDALVKWLDRGIRGGQAFDAKMLWRGTLSQFPFDDRTGTMQILGTVSDATLDYAEGWPIITHLTADLAFTSHGMTIQAKQGFLGNIPFRDARVNLPSYTQPHLFIAGHLQDQLQNAWNFLNHSPLQKKLSSLLTQLQGQGPVDLMLKLMIPLDEDTLPIRYEGHLSFMNDMLSLMAFPIQIDHVQGALAFDEAQMHGQFTAQWLQQLWKFKADAPPNTAGLQLFMQGRVPLASWMKINYPSWAEKVQGSSDAQITAQIPGEANGAFHLNVDSTLQGVALQSLIGLNKTADALAPLHFDLSKEAFRDWFMKLEWASPQGHVNLQKQGSRWDFASPVAAGKIFSPENWMPVWRIYLRYLDLRKVSDVMDTSSPITRLPAINFEANQVQLPKNNFNRIAFKLQPMDKGMLVKDLQVNHDKFQITGQGAWFIQNNEQVSTHIQGQLNTNSLGDTLDSLGIPQLVNSTKAQINFNLRWPGVLWSIDRNTMFGQLQLKTGQGAFTDLSSQTSVQIDLGRLLNLLSISTLTTHFGELTQKGFAFSQIEGALSLSPGQINPIDISINGMVANVQLTGCVDQAKERLHLIAQVEPKLTSSLPVIATIAGGPIVGAFSFLADRLLTPAVGKISASYYAIEGNFHNPQTKKISELQAKDRVGVCQ